MSLFGMYGTFKARPGRRDELAGILQEAARAMKDVAGARVYIVYTPTSDADRVGVFEVWDSPEAHRASLQNEATKALIARARPLIDGPPESVQVEPLSGLGLSTG